MTVLAPLTKLPSAGLTWTGDDQDLPPSVVRTVKILTRAPVRGAPAVRRSSRTQVRSAPPVLPVAIRGWKVCPVATMVGAANVRPPSEEVVTHSSPGTLPAPT